MTGILESRYTFLLEVYEYYISIPFGDECFFSLGVLTHIYVRGGLLVMGRTMDGASHATPNIDYILDNKKGRRYFLSIS